MVIPAGIADEIADEAVAMTAFEDFVNEQVRAGRSILGSILQPTADEGGFRGLAGGERALTLIERQTGIRRSTIRAISRHRSAEFAVIEEKPGLCRGTSPAWPTRRLRSGDGLEHVGEILRGRRRIRLTTAFSAPTTSAAAAR